MLRNMLLVAVGGGCGAGLRFLCASICLHYWSADKLPLATMFVNISGSFLIGLLSVFLIADNAPSGLALLLITGVLGGYTTFSTFSIETVHMLRNGEVQLAFLYAFGSLAIGILAAFAGIVAGKYYQP